MERKSNVATEIGKVPLPGDIIEYCGGYYENDEYYTVGSVRVYQDGSIKVVAWSSFYQGWLNYWIDYSGRFIDRTDSYISVRYSPLHEYWETMRECSECEGLCTPTIKCFDCKEWKRRGKFRDFRGGLDKVFPIHTLPELRLGTVKGGYIKGMSLTAPFHLGESEKPEEFSSILATRFPRILRLEVTGKGKNLSPGTYTGQDAIDFLLAKEEEDGWYGD
jgi:hypothetical protein